MRSRAWLRSPASAGTWRSKLHGLGHEVVVLTQDEFAAEIEQQLERGTLPPGLRFDIYMPRWLARFRDIGLHCNQPALTWHITNLAWQFCALLYVRRRYHDAGFNLVHHVTIASIRHPSLLTLLNVPTVVGPLGGGDIIPRACGKAFRGRYRLCRAPARSPQLVAARQILIIRAAFHRARIIFLRTDAAIAAVPPRIAARYTCLRWSWCRRLGDGRARASPIGRAAASALLQEALLHLKGMHLGLRALAHARAQGVDAILTIVGDGPARADLERLTRQLSLTPHVTFRGHVTRDQVLRMYRDHHVMLFPSLRDAGGMVVLEAWGQALPVICFGLGGPGKMVDETCGPRRFCDKSQRS